ncbi:MAG TPA: MFS transporter [Acetobacteraceae bacterium]|nr:MFS transporter [Acetobacteraceae bacterium]HVB68883.1 MFS transporter [Acetobacteraceae bacterium]
MSTTVNSGGRLDRLPVSAFHYRIFWLIAAGMFFDGYDLYVGGNVLGATLHAGFSTLAQNARFISFTFIGMTLGSVLAGFLGDRFGRRFTYQFNLAVFGLASLAAGFAPSMAVLNALRFVMGLGLGAEIVVGYATMSEFAPPATRGRWLSFMAFVVVAGFPVTSLLGTLIIPHFGWRPMFVIAGVGALIVWYLRKRLPESPRWLEAHGQPDAAEALLRTIEAEVGATRPLPPPLPAPAPAAALGFASLFDPWLLRRLVVGSVTLITVNTLIFGFVNWLPTFFVLQGLSVTKSFVFALVIALGSPFGCALGAFGADYFGRRRLIIGASLLTILFGGIYPFAATPTLVLSVGFLLIVCIYVLTALLYGVYTPELFPTAVRLRANGLCNMLGRGATIFTPFIVVGLFRAYGVGGVLALMIGLLVVQIVVVAAWGIEPARRGLETLAPPAGLAGGG